MEPTFTAYIEYDLETKLYVGTVPGLVGAHTQGATLDELRNNLARSLSRSYNEFPGDYREMSVAPQRAAVRLSVG